MQTTTSLDTIILDRTATLLDQAEDSLRSLWYHALADPRDQTITQIANASHAVQQALRHLETLLEMSPAAALISTRLEDTDTGQPEYVPAAV